MTSLLQGVGRPMLAGALALISGCYCSHARPLPDADVLVPDAATADAPSVDTPAVDVPSVDPPSVDAPDAPEVDAPPRPTCFDEDVVAVVDSSGRMMIVPTSVTPIDEGWLVTYRHHAGYGAARIDRDGHLIEDRRGFDGPSQIVRVGDALVSFEWMSMRRTWWSPGGLQVGAPIAPGLVRAHDVVGDVLRLVVGETDAGGVVELSIVEVRPAGSTDLAATRGTLSSSATMDLGDLETTTLLLEGDTLTIISFGAPEDGVRVRRFQIDFSTLTEGGTVAAATLDDVEWTDAPSTVLSPPLGDRVVTSRVAEDGSALLSLENLPHGTRPGTPTTTWPLDATGPLQLLRDPTRFTVVAVGGARTYSRSAGEPIAEVPVDPRHGTYLRAGQDGDVLVVVYTEEDPAGGPPRLRMRCTELPSP